MIHNKVVAVAPVAPVAGAGPHIDHGAGGRSPNGRIGRGGEIDPGMVIGIIKPPAVVAADVSIALDGIDKPGGAVIHLAAAAGRRRIDGVDIRLDLLHLLLDGRLVRQILLLHLFDILQRAFHFGLLAGQAGLFAFGCDLGIRQVLLFDLHLLLQLPEFGNVIRQCLQQGAVMLRNAAEVFAVAEIAAQ